MDRVAEEMTPQQKADRELIKKACGLTTFEEDRERLTAYAKKQGK